MTESDAARARELFAALEPELVNDPALARRVVDALQKARSTPRRGRRSPAPIDPFAIFRNDPESLRPALEVLDVEQLKDVISEHAMDSSRLALKWKKADRLINFIVDVVEQRMRKGAAFLERTSDHRQKSEAPRPEIGDTGSAASPTPTPPEDDASREDTFHDAENAEDVSAADTSAADTTPRGTSPS